MTRRVAFIGFDKITALDLIGPFEVFATANDLTGTKLYELVILSRMGGPFKSEAHVEIAAHCSFGNASALDTIIVPGGAGLRDPHIGSLVAAFLSARAPRTRRLASVCTGLEALAQADLMNRRRATTHWRFADAMASKYPDIRIDPNAIYVRDGKFYSSAGITAGIDLALALVAEDEGEKVALRVARELVVYFKRSGGQEQFSEPLQFQTRAGKSFSDLPGWILRNIAGDLSVPAIAAHAGFGSRHFSRRFKDVFGSAPAAYLERLRLDEARRRLLLQRQSMDRVAKSVGYASTDVFRRAFERRFGIRPSDYIKNFTEADQVRQIDSWWACELSVAVTVRF